MKKIYLSIFSAFLILNLNAANDTIITVGNTFSPSTLTINVGDTVTWSNDDLGFHNVNGSLSVFPNNPVGFTSGNATTGGWTFEHIFNLAGTYNYQCDPHASMGMNGIIIVNSISVSVPGCTDSLACNFDSLATIDDSSCVYPTTSTTNDTACDTYTWDGVVYDTTGTYTNTYTNVAGCDSTVILNLTINNSTVDTVSITAIGSYTWPANGTTYTQSGTYSYTGSNANLIYAEDFTNGLGSEWSDTSEMFYNHQDYGSVAGEYGLSESLTLNLNNMILGDSITISFDLLLFGTWDGSSHPITSSNAPDIFSLSANNNQLLNATFSNIDSNLSGWTYSCTQSYPDDFGQGTNPALTGSYYYSDTFSASGCDNGTGICTGAANLSTCGGGGVAVYRINKTFYNNSTSVNIEFSSNLGGTAIIGNNGGCDEYWSIDNIEVSSLLTNNTLINANGCDSTVILNLNIVPNPVDLFFSEYGEGDANNKYLEIYNTTNDTVDLINYALARVNNTPNNGTGVYEYWVDFNSGAEILPNNVFVVAHPSADSSILIHADMTYGSLSNGNDGFALVYGTEPAIAEPPGNTYIALDWIGTWDGDYINNPGSSNDGWNVAGVSLATIDHTLIRKCPINQGDTSWLNAAGTDPVSSQWIVRPQNDWTNIGFHNTCICDSTTNSYTSITDTLCNGLSITVGNSTYDSTGVYSDTLLAYNGCDSIITTNLTVLNSSVSSTVNTITICNGDSVTIGSNVYTMTGSYTDILTNVAGCDSIITTHVTVQTPVFQNFTICDGDSITVGNSVYYLSGNYTDTIISSIGCDSIVHTNVTVYSQLLISGGIPDNTVGGGAYFSNSTQHLELSCYIGSELVSAVVYSQDTSINTFEIRDNAGNVLDSVTVTVIPGGHRIYFNYQMAAGMDYQLGVNGLPDGLFRNNSGVNYPYNFASAAAITSSSAGGNYYYFFYDIEVRASGPAALTTDYTICDGDSITVAGNTYTVSGLYTDSLTSSIGCDSLVFSNLIVNPNVSYTNTQTICSGEITIVGNSAYDSTGVYVDTLTSWLGCDSIVTTNLTVLSISGGTTTNNQTICFGDSLSVGNNIYYGDGIYHDTLQDINGCDSIIITTLTTNGGGFLYGGKADTTNTAPMTGMYSSYNGRLNLDNVSPCILKSATVYAQDTNSVTFELRNSNGIVLQNVTHTVYPGMQRLNFNFLIPVDSNLQLGISAGGSGLYRNNAGSGNSMDYPYNIGSVTINSANTGSTQYYYFYYDLEVISSYIDTTICNGDSIQIGSNTYHTAGGYIDTMTTSLLCDSIVYVMLDLYQSPSLTITSVPNPPEICLGDSIVLEGSAGFTYYWWDNGVVSDRLVDDPTVDTWYLLTAKDSNNCVVKEDIWVYVDSCISGIDYPLVNEISIYPNPTNGVLNIISDLNIEKISLYSVDGRLIEKTRNTSLFIKTKGIYFIKVKTSKGNIIRRIVVN